jgi:hypothetical protein
VPTIFVAVGTLRFAHPADPSHRSTFSRHGGGPWTCGYAGWTDYAARKGIGCVPGSIVKGGDGINYVCPVELLH